MSQASADIPSPPTSPPGIFAVVVLYKMPLEQSVTVQTLLEAVRTLGDTPVRFAIMVVDNTPGGQNPGPLPEGISYVAAPHNPGLAAAYNSALGNAAQQGYDWLLTLDQDTSLPPDFLSAMCSYVKQYAGVPEVAAIVPHIADNGRIISPFRFHGGFLPRVLSPETKGISRRHTSALNSTSLLRVSALQEVGGYDPRFPLHNSDTSLYHRLDRAGKRVAIASDILVEHELAILQRQDRISPDRYHAMLVDECTFWDLHMGLLGRIERTVRLAGRICKGYLQKEDAVFRNIAIAEIRRRLLTRKRDRMKAAS